MGVRTKRTGTHPGNAPCIERAVLHSRLSLSVKGKRFRTETLQVVECGTPAAAHAARRGAVAVRARELFVENRAGGVLATISVCRAQSGWCESRVTTTEALMKNVQSGARAARGESRGRRIPAVRTLRAGLACSAACRESCFSCLGFPISMCICGARIGRRGENASGGGLVAKKRLRCVLYSR